MQREIGDAASVVGRGIGGSSASSRGGSRPSAALTMMPLGFRGGLLGFFAIFSTHRIQENNGPLEIRVSRLRLATSCGGVRPASAKREPARSLENTLHILLTMKQGTKLLGDVWGAISTCLLLILRNNLARPGT